METKTQATAKQINYMTKEPTALLADWLAELDHAEKRTVETITSCRNAGVTWQAIADVFGHGNRSAAKKWYDRRR